MGVAWLMWGHTDNSQLRKEVKGSVIWRPAWCHIECQTVSPLKLSEEQLVLQAPAYQTAPKQHFQILQYMDLIFGICHWNNTIGWSGKKQWSENQQKNDKPYILLYLVQLHLKNISKFAKTGICLRWNYDMHVADWGEHQFTKQDYCKMITERRDFEN